MVVFGLVQPNIDELISSNEAAWDEDCSYCLPVLSSSDSAAPGGGPLHVLQALLSWEPSGAWTRPSGQSRLAALHPPGRSGPLFSNRLQGRAVSRLVE